MTTEKALREALKFYAACVGVGGEEAFLDDRGEKARAALSLPETQGEPVAWMYVWPKNNLPYLTRHIYDERLSVEARAARAAVGVKEFPLYAAPPSQPAQGWKLVPVEPTQAMMEAAAPFPEHLRAEHPNPDDPWHEGMFIATKCDQLAARTTYRAMLAAVPAAPTQAKPTNGEGA